MPTLSSVAVGMLAATLLGASMTVTAGQLPVTAVDFSPAAQEKLVQYGTQETATLQAAILESVSREAARLPLPEGLSVTITVRDVAPTRPTRTQMADNPALDDMRTRYLGGAELVGEVHDAHQHLMTTVRYRYFPASVRQGALAFDPWADARLAIGQFAVKLTAACRKLAAH